MSSGSVFETFSTQAYERRAKIAMMKNLGFTRSSIARSMDPLGVISPVLIADRVDQGEQRGAAVK